MIPPVWRKIRIPANSRHHRLLVLLVPLLHLFVAHMRDVLNREIFHKFGEVSADICNCNIEWFLKLDKPISVSDLCGREKILVLSHLRKRISIHYSLWYHGSLRLLHEAIIWSLVGTMLRAGTIRVDRVLLLRGIIVTDIHTGVNLLTSSVGGCRHG